jgi:hypothetical protein
MSEVVKKPRSLEMSIPFVSARTIVALRKQVERFERLFRSEKGHASGLKCDWERAVGELDVAKERAERSEAALHDAEICRNNLVTQAREIVGDKHVKGTSYIHEVFTLVYDQAATIGSLQTELDTAKVELMELRGERAEFACKPISVEPKPESAGGPGCVDQDDQPWGVTQS